VAPKRRRAGKMTPVEEPDSTVDDERAEPRTARKISRPTHVTVNGVSVIPDPTPLDATSAVSG